jgi:hypothetical protein
MKHKIFALTSICMIAGASQAAIVSVSGPGVIINNPVNVAPGIVQTANVNVFAEKGPVLDSVGMPLDHVNVGLVNSPGSLVPGSVMAGTLIHSYFIHFDPVGSLSREGSVRFDQKIIGVIIDNPKFNASNPLVGLLGNTYGTASGAYGVELAANGDRFGISPDRYTLGFRFAATDPGDRIRVITAVPEPASMTALGLGAIALLRRRKK